MPARYALLLALLLAAGPVALGQPPADFTPAPFTPPGPNIALHKPYTLDPAPNYGDCTFDPQRTVLTDGVYTTGYFWVAQTTVGWVHQRPVIVTIDLGQVQPIAGLSYSTAAGVAGVHWPLSIQVLVSDDGKQWTVSGDLITLSNKRGAPPPEPYRRHTFATADLQTRGRYVALIVDQAPYTVVDEIEVYRGHEAWVTQPAPGRKVTMAPREYQRVAQTANSARTRMRADLERVLRELDSTKLSEAEKGRLRTRAAQLEAEIQTFENVPEDFTTLLPLNDLQGRIYALNAPVLRARGYKTLTVWGAYRYDPLQPLEAPAAPPAKPLPLTVHMMRNEHRAEVLNLTNPTDTPLTATIKVSGLGRHAPALTLREVLFTDTRDLRPVASALGPKTPADQGLSLTIPAGMTKQIWLDCATHNTPAGDARASLTMTSGRSEQTVPLDLHVTAFVMPAGFSTAIGGWDETNNYGGYDVTAENMMPLIANLRDHGVNMPWSNPQVMPTPGQYDAEGNMTAPPDFTSWDQWVERWRGAKCWGLFPNVKNNFAGEPMGTPRFNKMVGAWVTAWVQHAAAQGIKPSQIMILLVDEPRTDEQDRIIIAWAQALHAAQPELVVWNDPIHPAPEQVAPEFYRVTDVLCLNTTLFLRNGKAYQDFIQAKQQQGCELWFYSCSGPSKLLDPATYYRGQFWLNLKYGGKGSCYWAFGDEGGNSWNAYLQSRTCYSPLFLSRTAVTDAKQMEAIREGAEDVEYFVMLRERVVELERRGRSGRFLTEAKTLLTAGPEQAVAIMGADKQPWEVPKDRAVMDRVRLQALDLLEKLSRL